MVPLAVTGVGLYAVWPTLLETLGAAPRLQRIAPVWFVVMVAAEVGSFVCLWYLTRLTLRGAPLHLVATTQLVSNAISRVVPGGAATGGAAQYQMLVRGGIDPVTVGTGVTAVSLITVGTVFVLPLAALPGIFTGLVIPEALQAAVVIGAVVIVLLLAVGAAFLLADAPLRQVGRLLNWLLPRLPWRRRRDDEPDMVERLCTSRDQLRGVLGRHWQWAVAQSVGKVALDYGALVAALAALGADTRPGLVVLAFVAANALGMVPITPGGLGFVEAGLTSTLTLAGVPARTAVTATLAYRLVSYWLPLAAGPVAYLAYRRRYGAAPDLPS